MSYIGSDYTQQLTTPAVDYFNGNGVTTTFQLSRAVTSVNAIQVVVNNVPQNARDAYGITAINQIVFTSAPSAGTNNIYVIYDSQVGQFVTPSPGTVVAASLASGAISQSALDVSIGGGTGAMLLPSGTTAQRPSSPVLGMQRWNTTLGVMEVFVGGASWQSVASTSYSVDYLIVAGGGAGSGDLGGGGGGGGLVQGVSLSVSPGNSYSFVIGAGGAGQTGQGQLPNNGNPSTAFGLTAIGGGGGGGEGNFNGRGGGSGGGAGYAGTIGNGTAGQGNNGGTGINAGPRYPTGGGGGAGGVGGNAPSSTAAGNGGIGIDWQGLGTYYAGGGGGSTYANAGTRGIGGLGGGGNGRSLLSETVGAGAANTGGGSGGQGAEDGGTGANGGSGVVIVRYLSVAQRGSGGIVSSNAGYIYHTFTTSGTFVA